MNEWFVIYQDGDKHTVLIKSKPDGRLSLIAGHENLTFRHPDPEVVARHVRRIAAPCETPPQAHKDDLP